METKIWAVTVSKQPVSKLSVGDALQQKSCHLKIEEVQRKNQDNHTMSTKEKEIEENPRKDSGQSATNLCVIIRDMLLQTDCHLKLEHMHAQITNVTVKTASSSLDNNAIWSTSIYDLAKMHHSRENQWERHRERDPDEFAANLCVIIMHI